MRRAALIVNPKAGSSASFESRRTDVLRVFAARGVKVEVHSTTAEPNSARDFAMEASRTCDTVIACGGDGTVHGVLQGIAGTSTALGVLPCGTANALARNLQLPLDPVRATEMLLSFEPRRIALGSAQTTNASRWFTVMAGAGPDGKLIHEMKLAAKAQAGRKAYYTEAARLFLTRRFPAFEVQYRMSGASTWRSCPAVAMMASRIPDLGGLFSGLTRASRLHHPHLLVQLLAAPAHLAFPAWLTLSKAGLGRANPWLTTLEVEELRCMPAQPESQDYAQVDGETVGPIPMSLRIVPSALSLLMPLAP